MDGGNGYKYVGFDLLWHWIWNCHARGLGLRFRIEHIDLENRTLVSCGGDLES